MQSCADIVCLGVPLSAAGVVCLFVHGRTQSPEAMEDAVIRHLSTPGVAYILPRAKGASWYDARAIDALTPVSRAALATSIDVVRQLIQAIQKDAPDVPILLCGFSQGACLALEYAFADGPWHGALAALTGCRVGQAGDARPVKALTDLSVYLTGGDTDPWIPVAAFADAVAAVGVAHARLRADVFPGRGHEVSIAEIAVLDAMLADLAAGRSVSLEQGS